MRAKLFRGVPFARTGWQDYLADELKLPDTGMVRVHRSQSEVAASAPTFEGVPITMDHPGVMLDESTASAAAVGIASGVTFDTATEQVRADLLIWEPEAIEAVASGIRELSGGYEAEYTQREPGAYDQTGVRGNHIALVPAGRSGSAQRIGG